MPSENYGLKKGLQSNRSSIDKIPTGVMELKLPIAVQTVSSSIIRAGKRNEEGGTVVIFEMKAYQNLYTLKQKDVTVKFKG